MSLTKAVLDHSEQIEVLGVLFEGAFGGPPTIETTAGYNAALDAFEFVADVEQLTVPFFPDGGLPQLMVIDSTTMTIVYKATGYDEAAILEAGNGV